MTPLPAPDAPSPSSDSAPGSTPTETTATPKPLWRAGTLTYTSGGLVTLFLLLLWGDFAWAMRDRSVGGMAAWYLNSIGVPNLLFGLLLTSFPALVALILGPIISVKSDRHRGPRGRRIPFLLLTTPIAAFGMLGLAWTPVLARWLHGLGQPGSPLGSWLHEHLGASASGGRILELLENEMIVAVVCFGVFWAAFEFATIAGQAVFGGLINDVVPKPLLGRFLRAVPRSQPDRRHDLQFLDHGQSAQPLHSDPLDHRCLLRSRVPLGVFQSGLASKKWTVA